MNNSLMLEIQRSLVIAANVIGEVCVSSVTGHNQRSIMRTDGYDV